MENDSTLQQLVVDVQILTTVAATFTIKGNISS
jgi:hypothetical protein